MNYFHSEFKFLTENSMLTLAGQDQTLFFRVLGN
jgi:hypothetical protein